MSAKQKVGELRPSQIMFTYGVGAIVDLPYLSVIVMGLEDWPADPGLAREISEERLLRSVHRRLGPRVQKLLSPPVAPASTGYPNPFDESARIGVPVAHFPRWLLCPRCQLLATISSSLFEFKYSHYHPDRARYVHVSCPRSKKPPTAVPARFMVACENGHLDDFPWIEFVHQGPTDCHAVLRLIEYGPSGEARDLEARCETCGKRRRMAAAFGETGRARLPLCRGRRPHLRDYEDQPCELQVKAILLGASNLWFPAVLSALAIPSQSARLGQLVEEKWTMLKGVVNLQNVALFRQAAMLGDFYGYTDQEVWDAIEGYRQQAESGQQPDPDDLKGPEWEMLTHPQASVSNDDFSLRQVDAPDGFESIIEKVVLVEKLREVRALVGFTRIEAPGEFGESPDDVGGRRMKLSRSSPLWVPAAEVRGEGIFVQFRESQIRQWLAQPAVRWRDQQFHDSHTRWRAARHIEPPQEGYPGMRYVLLHTFAHALMRQLTLECGYTAASVRERIYSRNPGDVPERPEPMAGVLIYTAAPDSEGTLGGLVNLGQPGELRRHLRAALRSAALCASDPLCAENLPSQRGVTLHAAACHACLLAPETSCERGNKYLDRSVLAPTVERDELAMFEVQSV